MESLTMPGKQAARYLERDAAVVSPSYTRPYPFMMDHGKGCEVWDVDGNRFLDFASGIAVCSTGHCHPRVVEAIKEQSEKFLHISSDFYHPTWIEFSERVAATAPFKEKARVFLGNSGTEAVEAAIKLARVHSGRQQYIGFYGAFHGRSMGALSFTARKPVFRRGFMPLVNGVFHAPFPDTYRPVLQFGDGDYGTAVVDFIENVLFERVVPADDCAAILVEPIQGEGGFIVPPKSFFPALRQLCDKYGILLIVDEVQSGVGRTGKWWAIENWGVEPDIVCFAKGIASGMPLGGILARESVMDWPAGSHGNTFGGNPISCSAGIATLDLIGNGLMDNAKEMGEYVKDALEEIQMRHPSIGVVRGIGLMIGVEFVMDKATKEPAPELRDFVIEEAFRTGLITLGCGTSTLRIAPPLMIDRPVIAEALAIIEAAITKAEGKYLT